VAVIDVASFEQGGDSASQFFVVQKWLILFDANDLDLVPGSKTISCLMPVRWTIVGFRSGSWKSSV